MFWKMISSRLFLARVFNPEQLLAVKISRALITTIATWLHLAKIVDLTMPVCAVH